MWVGLPRWQHGKESACQWRRYKKLGFDRWVGKIFWIQQQSGHPVAQLGERNIKPTSRRDHYPSCTPETRICKRIPKWPHPQKSWSSLGFTVNLVHMGMNWGSSAMGRNDNLHHKSPCLGWCCKTQTALPGWLCSPGWSLHWNTGFRIFWIRYPKYWTSWSINLRQEHYL